MTCKFTFMTGLSAVSIALWAWGAAHAAVDSAPPQNLFPNPEFRQKDASGKPTGYQFTGGAEFAFPGNPRTDVSGLGRGAQVHRSSRDGVAVDQNGRHCQQQVVSV